MQTRFSSNVMRPGRHGSIARIVGLAAGVVVLAATVGMIAFALKPR
jgi:hypothetical protein